MPHKRKRGNYSVWFAEIPVALKAEFSKLYPGRKNIRAFTIAFVNWAVTHKPDIEALQTKWVTYTEEKHDNAQVVTGATPEVPTDDSKEAGDKAPGQQSTGTP